MGWFFKKNEKKEEKIVDIIEDVITVWTSLEKLISKNDIDLVRIYTNSRNEINLIIKDIYLLLHWERKNNEKSFDDKTKRNISILLKEIENYKSKKSYDPLMERFIFLMNNFILPNANKFKKIEEVYLTESKDEIKNNKNETILNFKAIYYKILDDWPNLQNIIKKNYSNLAPIYNLNNQKINSIIKDIERLMVLNKEFDYKIFDKKISNKINVLLKNINNYKKKEKYESLMKTLDLLMNSYISNNKIKDELNNNFRNEKIA